MSPTSRKRLLHVVIDGLGASALDRELAAGEAPHMQALIDAGATTGMAISPFPSLTPVCLATLITGSMPDVHRIPSLSWYHRGQRRFVEYGSSFGATIVEGARQTVEDVVFNLNHVHLAEYPPTLFELVEDAGGMAASINYLIYRGRNRHGLKYPIAPATRWYGQFEAVYGPTWFWYGELFGPRRPRVPQVGIKRPKDMSASRMARWLVRSTDTNYILLYLGEHDKVAHASGPHDVTSAVRRADRAIGRVIDECGGLEAFLDAWGIIVCADHGQTIIEDDSHHTWSDVFDDVPLFRGARAHDETRTVATQIRRRNAITVAPQLAIAPSNRSAMIYRLDDGAPSAEHIAERAVAEDAADVVTYVEDGTLHVLRGSHRLTARPDVDGLDPLPCGSARTYIGERRWALDGDLDALDLTVIDDAIHFGDYPDALARLAAAHACVNAGDVLISATEGWEFTDIGGSAHSGGSHGSLHAGDSLAAFLCAGLDGIHLPQHTVVRLADIYSLVGAHFGLLPAGPFPGAGMSREDTPD